MRHDVLITVHFICNQVKKAVIYSNHQTDPEVQMPCLRSGNMSVMGDKIL